MGKKMGAPSKEERIGKYLKNLLECQNEEAREQLAKSLRVNRPLMKLADEVIDGAICEYKNTPVELLDVETLVKETSKELCDIMVRYRPALHLLSYLSKGAGITFRDKNTYMGLPIDITPTTNGFRIVYNGLDIMYNSITKTYKYERIIQ